MADARTVIFDFDGTLVESLWPGFHVYNRIAPEFGFRTFNESEVERCRDMSTRDLLKHAEVPLFKLPILVKRLRDEMRREFSSIPIAPGIEACLAALDEAGIRLGIVSSNAKDIIKACLTKNRVFSYFDFLHTSINLFGKHRTLNWVITTKGIKREGAVYVGDENRDIEAAQKSNIPGVAVGWGFQSEQKLRSTAPSFFAARPMDLVKYILDLDSRSD